MVVRQKFGFDHVFALCFGLLAAVLILEVEGRRDARRELELERDLGGSSVEEATWNREDFVVELKEGFV